MYMRTLALITFLFSINCFADLTPTSCIDSDLQFLSELEIRANAKDDSLFNDERIFQTATRLIYLYERRTKNSITPEYDLAKLRKALSFPDCESLRNVEPPSSTQQIKSKLDYKKSVLRFGCGKDEETGHVGCWPGVSTGRVSVNSTSSESQKSKAFKEFKKKVLDAREEVLVVTGVPFSNKYPRTEDGTYHWLSELNVSCNQTGCY